jgi:hypothetical protein
MFKLLATAVAMLFFGQLFGQTVTGRAAVDNGYNFDFEKKTTDDVLPDLWSRFNEAKGYKCNVYISNKPTPPKPTHLPA